ncbi:uncharacterized protein EV420DRAFT_1481052, partial [Desarmillaria tabescens]
TFGGLQNNTFALRPSDSVAHLLFQKHLDLEDYYIAKHAILYCNVQGFFQYYCYCVLVLHITPELLRVCVCESLGTHRASSMEWVWYSYDGTHITILYGDVALDRENWEQDHKQDRAKVEEIIKRNTNRKVPMQSAAAGLRMISSIKAYPTIFSSSRSELALLTDRSIYFLWQNMRYPIHTLSLSKEKLPVVAVQETVFAEGSDEVMGHREAWHIRVLCEWREMLLQMTC